MNQPYNCISTPFHGLPPRCPTNMKAKSESAIARLKAIESGLNEGFIVELTKPSKGKNKFTFFTISDGQSKFKGMIEVRNPSQNIRAIMERLKVTVLKVRITQHITHYEDHQPQCIQIVDFDLFDDACRTERKASKRALKVKEEEPQQINVYEDEQFSFFGNTEVKSLETVIKENLQENERNRMMQPKTEQMKASQDSVQTCAERANGCESQYQKINDLYLQFYNWSLVVKVTNVNYREFISKQGKQTKVLAVDLIDEDGSTISGSCFGQLAFDRQKQFEIGQTYLISKGKVKLETYNRSSKSSKYSLLFSQDTTVQPTHNSALSYIEADEEWLRLSEIGKAIDSEQPSNFVGVVVEVQTPREQRKEDRLFVIQNLKVWDPITSWTCEVVVWNRQVQVREYLLNKSVLLRMFKPKKFQDRYQLNSTNSSAIYPHHFFAAHQAKHQQVTSKPKYQFKTIRQLAEELEGQDLRKTTESTLNVWVKEIGFDKKWFYDACPNPRCKKNCGNNNSNRCQHCLFDFVNCDKRFMLEVKLADMTGSLQVTAFDESASVLLKGTQMDQLFPMTNKELCVFSQSEFCYEQYRLQIASSADKTGRMKHTIRGKPVKLTPNEAISHNLALIRSLAVELGCLEDN